MMNSKKINKNKLRWFYVEAVRNIGIVLVLLGVLALIVTVAAPLAVDLILGLHILLAAVTQVMHALRNKGSSRFELTGQSR